MAEARDAGQTKEEEGNYTGSGSRDWLPGKSIGKLPGCGGMGSGRPRHSWS